MIELKPKSKFAATPDAKLHAELVASEAFQARLQAALLEMTLRQPSTGNPSLHWDSHCKLAGAREFISILLNLAEPEVAPSRLPNKNLNPYTDPKPLTKKVGKHASDNLSSPHHD